jgi:histone-lysine N-methyltransferase SETMAR
LFSSSQKQARVGMSQDRPQVLRLAKHHAWKYIATLDEVWFHFSNHFDPIRLPHDELPPFFPKQTIASQKLMITVVWNSHGCHVIQCLPKGIKWTSRYYSDNILSSIAALWDVGSHRKMAVHADNTRSHVAKCVTEYMDHNSLNRTPPPPYSPHLAPSDFYLFGDVKH